MDNRRGGVPVTSEQACILLRMSLTNEQLKERKGFIGGSDIAAVCGVDPFKFPIDIYQEKLGMKPTEVSDVFHVERGNFYEKPTADWWAYRRSAKLISPTTLRDEKRPYFGAHPDFYGQTLDGMLLLSIKVPASSLHLWGESGTHDVPFQHIMQLQWELMLDRNVDRGEIAAPVYGNLRIYPFDSDLELQSLMAEAGEKFWKDYVEKRQPPPVDASKSYAKYLRQRFKESNGERLTGTADGAALAGIITGAKVAIAEAEARELEARNKLTALIGTAKAMDFDFGSAVMVEVKSKDEFNTEAAYSAVEELLPPTKRLEIRTIFTKKTGGYRYLRFYPKGKSNGK